MEAAGRELISVELQKQGHYTGKEGGTTRVLDWKLRLLRFVIYFLSALDSEVCHTAASGFIFLHLQHRATTAQPSERMRGHVLCVKHTDIF